MARFDLNEELAALADFSPAQLREKWSRVTAKPTPRISIKLLRLALAWELQAKVHGGLPRKTSNRLAALATARATDRSAQPGMRLVREWNGKLHIVTIGDDKVIRWNEREWKSLSEVARTITGTRWSGPVFFGLKQRKAAA